MKLEELIEGISYLDSRGPLNSLIRGLACDSREVRGGYMFVAVRGHENDGHDFIDSAIKRGASAIVFDSRLPLYNFPDTVTLIQVPDSREALSDLAVRFYDKPYEGMELVGITGTNGKTTTSYILESIIRAAGAQPGIIGTINYRYQGKSRPAQVTTPGPLELMRMLREMKDGGVTHVVMEVSSHALEQGRVSRCPFKVALFTNFSRDHLDYHGSMESYFEAKSLLFQSLNNHYNHEIRWAVLNRDDERSEDLERITVAPVLTYGFGRGSHLRAREVELSKEGIRAYLETPEGALKVSSSLIGKFNVYNIMAAFAGARCLEIDDETIIQGIADLKSVPGRLEKVENSRSLSIIVDYAHTPDALMKAIDAIQPIRKGRLITLFGCGGDRDQGKRGPMGRVAATYSDLTIITSDNPRREDPLEIVRQVEQGVLEAGGRRLESSPGKTVAKGSYILEVDREKAIEKAVRIAEKDDLVLIAGKGHEDYQIRGAEKRHFDDREIARAFAS